MANFGAGKGKGVCLEPKGTVVMPAAGRKPLISCFEGGKRSNSLFSVIADDFSNCYPYSKKSIRVKQNYL